MGDVCRSLHLLPLSFPSRKLWTKKKENFAMVKSVGKIDLDPDAENIPLHTRTFNLFAQLSSSPKVRIMYN